MLCDCTNLGTSPNPMVYHPVPLNLTILGYYPTSWCWKKTPQMPSGSCQLCHCHGCGSTCRCREVSCRLQTVVISSLQYRFATNKSIYIYIYTHGYSTYFMFLFICVFFWLYLFIHGQTLPCIILNFWSCSLLPRPPGASLVWEYHSWEMVNSGARKRDGREHVIDIQLWL